MHLHRQHVCYNQFMLLLIMVFSLSFVFPVQHAHAGAAVARQQQLKAMKEQAYQQAVQQAIAERQAQEQQAYAQAQAQQAYAQAQAQAQAQAAYQMAQYQAAKEYIAQYQQYIAQKIAAYVSAKQMDNLQQQMVQQVVQQQLIQYVAAQIQAKQAAQIQDVMVAQAVQEAMVKLGMQAYVNEQAKQVLAARQVLATQQVAATSQAQQMQAAKTLVSDPQIQSSISQKADQFLSHAQSNTSADVFKQAVSNVLVRDLVKQASERGSIDLSPTAVDLAVSEAAEMLGIQRVYATTHSGGADDPVLGNDVMDVVDIEEVWKKLDNNSRAWRLLMDEQAKVMTVNEFIERYRKRKIRISKSPQYYATMVDEMAAQNPAMLDSPFMGIIQILAVMEYDFDYGGDRDALARKVLGSMYESNKQRLSSGR